MTYNYGFSGLPDPVVLSTMTDSMANLAAATAIGASSAFPTAATAYFFPVKLSRARTYTKAWWLNGATAAGNVDVGIYTISGTTATRVVASTAVAQAGVSDIQVATTFTTTTIGPGLYYIALSASLATATFWRSNLNSMLLRGLVFQAATSHPLPATATVAAISSSYVPVFGFAERATV